MCYFQPNGRSTRPVICFNKPRAQNHDCTPICFVMTKFINPQFIQTLFNRHKNIHIYINIYQGVAYRSIFSLLATPSTIIHINRLIRNSSSLEREKKKSNMFLSRAGFLLHIHYLKRLLLDVVGFLLFRPSFGAVKLKLCFCRSLEDSFAYFAACIFVFTNAWY